MLIISIVIYKTLNISHKNNISSYNQFCNTLTKNSHPIITSALNITVTLFMMITFYVMISGFSSLLYQELHINKLLGSLFILIPCYFIFQKNIRGLLNTSKYLIPILIFFIIFISLKNIQPFKQYILNQITYSFYSTQTPTNNFCTSIILPLISSILYASYNCIILIPVIISISNITQTKKDNLITSSLCFTIMIFLSIAIYNLLLQGNTTIFHIEMPIMKIAENLGNTYKLIYIILILIAIFTTAISTGYGAIDNLNKKPQKNTKSTIIILTTALFLSQISFSTLINLLYPTLGILGLFEITLLLI